jgi:pyruvate ferredoxin oxidoreductase beta subunit
VATACPSYPFDLFDKVKRAQAVEGPAYIHVFSVCPTGWRSAPELSVKMGRLAVETGVFPLYEIVNGQYRLSMDISPLRPVVEYTKVQGRFRHLTPDLLEQMQGRVIKSYEELKKKASG